MQHVLQVAGNTHVTSHDAGANMTMDLLLQGRCSIHDHGLRWAADAPPLGAADDVVAAYVDMYITCNSVPADAALQQLVLDVQQHICAVGRCRSSNVAPCRYMFPRPPLPRTMVLHALQTKDSVPGVEDDDALSVEDIQQAHQDWKVVKAAVEALGLLVCPAYSSMHRSCLSITCLPQHVPCFHACHHKLHAV